MLKESRREVEPLLYNQPPSPYQGEGGQRGIGLPRKPKGVRLMNNLFQPSLTLQNANVTLSLPPEAMSFGGLLESRRC